MTTCASLYVVCLSNLSHHALVTSKNLTCCVSRSSVSFLPEQWLNKQCALFLKRTFQAPSHLTGFILPKMRGRDPRDKEKSVVLREKLLVVFHLRSIIISFPLRSNLCWLSRMKKSGGKKRITAELAHSKVRQQPSKMRIFSLGFMLDMWQTASLSGAWICELIRFQASFSVFEKDLQLSSCLFEVKPGWHNVMFLRASYPTVFNFPQS